eukprot:m51a1_g4348 hypothetical protein (227) ;mRNA; r:208583-209416
MGTSHSTSRRTRVQQQRQQRARDSLLCGSLLMLHRTRSTSTTQTSPLALSPSPSSAAPDPHVRVYSPLLAETLPAREDEAGFEVRVALWGSSVPLATPEQTLQRPVLWLQCSRGAAKRILRETDRAQAADELSDRDDTTGAPLNYCFAVTADLRFLRQAAAAYPWADFWKADWPFALLPGHDGDGVVCRSSAELRHALLQAEKDISVSFLGLTDRRRSTNVPNTSA